MNREPVQLRRTSQVLLMQRNRPVGPCALHLFQSLGRLPLWLSSSTLVTSTVPLQHMQAMDSLYRIPDQLLSSTYSIAALNKHRHRWRIHSCNTCKPCRAKS